MTMSRTFYITTDAKPRHDGVMPEYGRLVFFLVVTICVGAAQGYLLMLFGS